MTREEAKELMPVIQAFADGKDVETKTGSGWMIVENMSFAGEPDGYRIKSESKYRPFANAEECWQEMQKHQPFGVVKDKHFANYQTHRAFTFLTNEGCNFRGYEDMTFETSFKNLLFADGTPFGVKVEE